MDVGSELRDARERRRLSIDDLSRRLKIKPTILSAIDANDAARLPGGIFTRAFVKQYAREVGLDPADVVRRYETQFEPPPIPAAIAVATPIEIDDGVRDEDGGPDSLRLTDVRLLAVAAALMLIVVSYVALHRPRIEAPRAQPPAATNATLSHPGARIVNRPESQPVGTSGTARPALSAAAPTAAPVSAAAASALQVELRPRRPCWITATADGKRAAFRLLKGGERIALNASHELVLRIGDAASLDYSVNGSRGRTLGGRAEVVMIRLTPANYREFVAR